jgi:glycosyltransferase involved in cell wall biosynthesis
MTGNKQAIEKISVLVPTRRRPEMLRSALLSIQNQSRLDVIVEVLVSENSEDDRSEDVCRSFPDLPIRFTRQNPVKSLAGHFQWLVDHSSSEYVAWLSDDDMWGRYHLEEAARLLEQHPDAVAYTGECVTILNDSRTPIKGLRETMYSLLGDTSTLYKSCWLWSREDMLVNVLLHTPLSMWAMVFRKPALQKSLVCLVPSDVGYESDRLFLWKLAIEGPIIVGREIGLFYRTHENNTWVELWRQDQEEQKRLTSHYISSIIDEAESLGVQARTLWLGAWCSLDNSTKKRLLEKNGKQSLNEIRRRWGDEALWVEPEKPAPQSWHKPLQPFVPPLIWSLAARARGLLSARKKQR